jgi:hypothetical protein
VSFRRACPNRGEARKEGKRAHEGDVHEIDLGQDSNGPRSLRVDGSSELETVRVGQIGVGRSDGEDDGVWLGDELEKHVSNLLFDISRLVSDRDLQYNMMGR